MSEFSERLAGLSVAHLCDACLRAGLPMRVDSSLPPLITGQRTQGRARPVRHHGSVDVFLEALGSSRPGEVLVVDNQGRDDEGCIGDLTALEVQQAGLAGIVIWGRCRDTAILRTIGLPIFSRGACARGPERLDARDSETFASARIGDQLATAEDWVVADDDGVIFVEDSRLEEAILSAEAIRDVEALQTRRMQAGESLREQLRFVEYLSARAEDPGLDFRRHLRGLGAAIEE